jgi:hypothetical protein
VKFTTLTTRRPPRPGLARVPAFVMVAALAAAAVAVAVAPGVARASTPLPTQTFTAATAGEVPYSTTVTVSPEPVLFGSYTAVTITPIRSSSAYARLSPARQRTALAEVHRATRQLARLAGGCRGAQKEAVLKVDDLAVRAAEHRHYLTATQAAALIGEAGGR